MDDFTNEEVATVVSYAVDFENCEEALRRFKSKFGKEVPQVKLLRKWRQRFLETLGFENYMVLDGTNQPQIGELRWTHVDGFDWLHFFLDVRIVSLKITCGTSLPNLDLNRLSASSQFSKSTA